jgi:hypothetical protein
MRLPALLVGAVLLGELGHVLLDQLNAGLAHHIFHIAFPLVAFAVFAAYVMRDVRRHGRPRFTWRLNS